MTDTSIDSTSSDRGNPSAFTEIRNAQNLKELMSWLEGENIAAIVEALRLEKYAKDLIPLYLAHPNHVVRYEIACSDITSDEDLKILTKDSEQIVRQGALKNLRSRTLVKQAQEIKKSHSSQMAPPEKESPKKEANKESETPKPNKSKHKKQKNKKGRK